MWSNCKAAFGSEYSKTTTYTPRLYYFFFQKSSPFKGTKQSTVVFIPIFLKNTLRPYILQEYSSIHKLKAIKESWIVCLHLLSNFVKWTIIFLYFLTTLLHDCYCDWIYKEQWTGSGCTISCQLPSTHKYSTSFSMLLQTNGHSLTPRGPIGITCSVHSRKSESGRTPPPWSIRAHTNIERRGGGWFPDKQRRIRA